MTIKNDEIRDDTLLGFLSFCETANKDGYLGAILVTNSQGVPQEFRCTHPVKPTNIQKPLYGDALIPYIGINLCGLPLLTAIQKKPNVLLVRDDFLLGLRRVNADIPLAFLQRAGEAISISDGLNNHNQRERVDSSGGKYQPVVISAHPDFRGDLAITRQIIEGVFSSFDPLEPFERITRAVDVLAKQDKRFQ